MIKILHRLEWFLGLVLLQVLVLNQMHVGGYATPFFYIYFIAKLYSLHEKYKFLVLKTRLLQFTKNEPGIGC